MLNNLGYTKNLFILPFDHRSSFVKDIFGFTNLDLTPEQTQQIIDAKETIYEAFKLAAKDYIPEQQAAVLVDELFGDKILKDAKHKGFVTILTTEKSGQQEFTFEYGSEFSKHIEKYKPIFAKALIRYNPEDKESSKIRQRQQVKILSDYCHNNNFKFLLEVLIHPKDYQLIKAHDNKKLYDLEIRPKLTITMIEELQNAGIEPDVWKLEGMNFSKQYEDIIEQIRKNNRNNVGLVILGRAAEKEDVETWISKGSGVNGVIGFAVGRTIFLQPLIDLKNAKSSKQDAIDQIANNFKYFYDVFMKGKIKI